MRSPASLVAFMLVWTVSVFTQAPPAPADKLEARVLQLLKDGDVPGVSIAVVRDGSLAWHRGLGVTNAKTGEPVTDATVFEAASLSKPVFAYAVMKLVDAGTFDLDKPLTQYLPGTYDVGPDPRLDTMTARNVLSHTTGFPNWRSGSLRMYFTPGERFSYSGEGYVYLSRVVERVTGEPIDALMTRLVFEPLKMTSSSYAWRDAYKTSKSWYHNSRGEASFRGDRPATGNVAASLHTTGSDYGRFLVAMLNGTGLKPGTRDLMLTPISTAREGGAANVNRPDAKPFPEIQWGLGWGLQITADAPSFFHWGNNGDAKAYVAGRVKDRSAVVLFANGVHGLSIVPELLGEAFDWPQPAVRWLAIESYRR
jgi:CubicO group peptidase (beta-lactamase class C family)